jgi:argininosuccinate synthase
VLHTAHRELEKLVIARDLERIKHDLARTYADLVYNGLWFSQTREAIDAFVRTIQPRVTGSVRLKLFKGDCHIVGRKSAYALYDQALATYDAGDQFDRSATEGFIKIWGLRSRLRREKQPRTQRRSGADHGAPVVGTVRGRSGCGAVCLRRILGSIAASSKTTSGEAWRGRRGSSAPG